MMTKSPLRGGVDVAILGADNSSVRLQQTAVATACQEQGLSVHFLAEDLSAPAGRIATSYRKAGFETLELSSRTWRSGPFAYPSAPGQLRLLLYWKGILSEYRPRLVLTHADSGGTWGTLHAWAKSRGIRGVVLQEGVSARRRDEFVPGPRAGARRVASRIARRLGPRMIDERRPNYLFADHALVWGRMMEEQLVREGRNRTTIHVVGNPQFDRIDHVEPLASRGRRTLLFAQQPQPNESVEREACQLLIRTCADDVGCRLLFRPHPRGALRGDEVLTMARNTAAPGLVEVIDSGEIDDYFGRASAFATYYSVSAYRACLAGLPLVLLDWVSPMYELDAPSFGAALSVRAPAALCPALRLALDSDEHRADLFMGARRWLCAHIGTLDGGASHRAARVLADLIRRRAA